MQDTVWVTKDGRRILVSQMDTNHIMNCIIMIVNSKKGWRREYLERLRLELIIRDIRRRET